MGSADRAIRLVIGLVIIGVGIGMKSWWGAIGIIPLATAGIGWCPLYCPLKIDTGSSPKSSGD